MNPLRNVEILMMEQLNVSRRIELYLSGVFSIELVELGLISPDQLKGIIDHITSSLEEDMRARKDVSWPGSKNLAA